VIRPVQVAGHALGAVAYLFTDFLVGVYIAYVERYGDDEPGDRDTDIQARTDILRRLREKRGAS